MRYFDIEALSVETAGGSGMASLVQLQGIKDGRAFRDLVLAQRDKVALAGNANSKTASANVSSVVSGDQAIQLLSEIRDTMKNIESQLAKKS